MLTGGEVDEVLSVPRNATIGTGVLAVGSSTLTGGDVDEAFSVPRNVTAGTRGLCRFASLAPFEARENIAGSSLEPSLPCPLGLLLLVLVDIAVGLPNFPGFWGSVRNKRGLPL
jgi:hypothetical protein